MRYVESFGGYLLGVLYAIDQLFNRILFGSADHTISGRVGYWAVKGSRVSLVLELFINNLFFWQLSHCRGSIEWDEVPPYSGPIHKELFVCSRLRFVIRFVDWFVVSVVLYFLFYPSTELSCDTARTILSATAW